MRGPIAYGLSWPERIRSGAAALDFSCMAGLTFETVHTEEHRQRFPGLALAWSVLRAPPGSTAVLNAANEVAVAAFLEGKIRFDQIHFINDSTLSALTPRAPQSLGDLLEIDQEARRYARGALTRC